MPTTKPNRLTYTLVTLMSLFGVYFCYVLVMIADGRMMPWLFVNGPIMIATAACLWGLWRLRRWALNLSFVLLLLAFGWGVYFVHFVWTFWIFQEPTVKDRILNALNPQVSVFIIFPLLWAFYFSRSAAREQFQK